MSYQKKRHGGFYNQRNQKKKRNFVLEPGIQGFICTCNSREKECVREAYNILNEYADRLYGVESKNTQEESKNLPADEKPGDRGGEQEEEEDISTALTKEIAEFKQNPSKAYRFQVIESGANNCVFIRTTLSDPTDLAHYLMKDIESTKKQRSRFLLRLIPVEVTCKAFMDEIRKSAAALFDKYFSKEGKSFAIVFNHRNNNSITRNDIIEEFAEMIKFRNPNNRVDLTHPELTVIVEVIRAMCCMSVVPEYFKLLKYNLLELCGKGEKAALEAKKAENAGGGDEKAGEQSASVVGNSKLEEIGTDVNDQERVGEVEKEQKADENQDTVREEVEKEQKADENEETVREVEKEQKADEA